jgi:hypothetical protein
MGASGLFDPDDGHRLRAALRPIKGWLVASQYVNKAQESGTEHLWAS